MMAQSLFRHFFVVFSLLGDQQEIVSRETDDIRMIVALREATVFRKSVRRPKSGRNIGDSLAAYDKIVCQALDLHNNVS
jgi:hypothetical protein